jgi:hypothetical protein
MHVPGLIDVQTSQLQQHASSSRHRPAVILSVSIIRLAIECENPAEPLMSIPRRPPVITTWCLERAISFLSFSTSHGSVPKPPRGKTSKPYSVFQVVTRQDILTDYMAQEGTIGCQILESRRDADSSVPCYITLQHLEVDSGFEPRFAQQLRKGLHQGSVLHLIASHMVIPLRLACADVCHYADQSPAMFGTKIFGREYLR